MDSQSPFRQKPTEEINYDIKNLFCKYIKKWHWFAISVVICIFFALIYILTSSPVYKSTASIQIRPDRSANLSSQLSVVEGYGYINNKNSGDEIVILSSLKLMLEAISSLDVENTYYYKQNAKYIDLYNQSPIEVIFPENFRGKDLNIVEILIKKANNNYSISIKSNQAKEKLIVTDLRSPISTHLGEIKFIERWNMGSHTYKVINTPIEKLAIEYRKILKVMEESKRSSVIELSLETSSAEKSRDILNSLIKAYLAQDIKHKKQNSLDAISSIDVRLKTISNELFEIEKNIDQLNRQPKSTAKEQELSDAKRLYKAKEANFQFLMEKKEENELRSTTDIPEIQVIDYAYASIRPVAPKKAFALVIAVLMGCIIPLIVIYLLDFFNNKVENRKQLLSLLYAPFLGSVRTNKASQNTITANNEDFQDLRNSLQYILKDKQNPVTLVTSITDEEGKSYIASNLAVSFSSIQKKTVLIDIDTQHSSLTKYFNISQNAKGLVDYICNPDLPLSEITVPYKKNEYLTIIPAGKLTSNTADIIMSKRLDNLISELKKSYEHIIIDTTAVTKNGDTYQLKRFADNTLFVVRQNFTTYNSVKLINEINVAEKLNNISVVLNGTNK